MQEFVIYAMEQGGDVGGLGFDFPPSQQEISNAKAVFVFRRGDTRIYVLIVTGTVTEDAARQLAINLYEGRSRKINFNDAARIDREASLWRELQFS